MPKKYTTQDFISKARAVHGERYNYSKVVYKNSQESIIINCPEHGDFAQLPNNHLQGKECIKCSYKARNGNRDQRFNDFLVKAKCVHGELFDYSHVEYRGANIKISILCNKHGLFNQIPSSHLNGCGCPQCGFDKTARRQTSSKKEFVEKAIALHGKAYSYDKTIYKTAIKRVTITCPVHGDFFQTPNAHLSGKGCKACGHIDTSLKQTKSQELFLSQARKVHKNIYDYSKVKYKNSNHKVIVICKNHGEFKIRPASLIKGCGCAKCRDERLGNASRLTSDQLTEKVNSHGRVVCLNPEDHINSHTKLKFKCLIHGEEHEATPTMILSGSGLKCCRVVGGDSIDRFFDDKEWASKKTYVYVADVKGLYLKPGIASNLEQRVKNSGNNYSSYVFTSPPLERCEAWAIEQRILFDSSDASPDDVSELDDKWGGLTELRSKTHYPEQWYVNRFHYYLEQIQQYGWLEVAEHTTPDCLN